VATNMSMIREKKQARVTHISKDTKFGMVSTLLTTNQYGMNILIGAYK